MIQYIRQNDLDEEKWDACVRRDPSGHFYPLHWYLDMIAKRWDALVFDDYRWVMPLVHNKKWGIIPYLYRPYGTQQLGVFGAEPATEEIVNAFLKSIPKKFLFRDIFFNTHNSFPKEIPHIQRRTYEIDLGQSYEALYSKYKIQTKRNLKYAQKAGLRILENDSPDTLVRLFQNNKGSKLDGISDWHYARMKHIMYTLIYRKMGAVWSVYDDHNSICASAFMAFTDKRMVFLFSGQDDYGRKHGAMTKLIDEMITLGAGRGGIFDFEGSDLKGLEKFYANFGGIQKEYANYKGWW